MKSIISSHNKKLLNDTNPHKKAKKDCNCREPPCPLGDKCQTSAMVYIATVDPDDALYVGATEDTFKLRYGNHKKSFNNKKYGNETKLSNHVWDLKKQEITPTVSFKTLELSQPYMPGSRRCALCTAEKTQIQRHTKCFPRKCLNSRTELINTCRHRARWKLKNAHKVYY